MKWSILQDHTSPKGDFGNEEERNEHATQYDKEMLQLLWGTKEAELQYTCILSEAQQQEQFTVVPVFAPAWGKLWHQASSPERYHIHTLLLMIQWKERKGVFIDVQGGMREATGQSLI